MTTVRAALTETCNAFAPMPASVDDLCTLADRLEDIRRANVDHHIELIAAAAAAGAEIIGLGELFPAPYFALRRDEFWRGLAEDAEDGPTVRQLREVASEHGVVLVVPIYERAADKRFNTAVVIDKGGELRGKYRKCHIPEGSNEQGQFCETFYYSPSDGSSELLPVFDTAIGRIGVTICYDRHFEGLVSALAQRGAQLVFSPAVTFGAKSQRLWELEFEVEAARHNVILAGSNRRGSEAPWNQPYFGGSHFVGPNGRYPNRSEHSNLVIADLDFAELTAPDPSGWNLRRDARADLR